MKKRRLDLGSHIYYLFYQIKKCARDIISRYCGTSTKNIYWNSVYTYNTLILYIIYKYNLTRIHKWKYVYIYAFWRRQFITWNRCNIILRFHPQYYQTAQYYCVLHIYIVLTAKTFNSVLQLFSEMYSTTQCKRATE
jgi:hypothetical protein